MGNTPQGCFQKAKHEGPEQSACPGPFSFASNVHPSALASFGAGILRRWHPSALAFFGAGILRRWQPLCRLLRPLPRNVAVNSQRRMLGQAEAALPTACQSLPRGRSE